MNRHRIDYRLHDALSERIDAARKRMDYLRITQPIEATPALQSLVAAGAAFVRVVAHEAMQSAEILYQDLRARMRR